MNFFWCSNRAYLVIPPTANCCKLHLLDSGRPSIAGIFLAQNMFVFFFSLLQQAPCNGFAHFSVINITIQDCITGTKMSFFSICSFCFSKFCGYGVYFDHFYSSFLDTLTLV